MTGGWSRRSEESLGDEGIGEEFCVRKRTFQALPICDRLVLGAGLRVEPEIVGKQGACHRERIVDFKI